jgi:hypothetical protein
MDQAAGNEAARARRVLRAKRARPADVKSGGGGGFWLMLLLAIGAAAFLTTAGLMLVVRAPS